MKSFLVLLFSLLSCQIYADTFRWCAYFDWPPWIYKNQQATYSGILIEQLELFKVRNPDMSFVMKDIDSWKRCQESVANGSTDFILGANKTPERAAKFHYLQQPLFINKTVINAYSSFTSGIPNVSALEDLRFYTLALVRGNSYGSPIDGFVQSLKVGKNKVELSTLSQVMKFVALQRADYFFLPQSSYQKQLEDLNHSNDGNHSEFRFKTVLEIERATPVYLAFSKKTQAYSVLGERWLKSIEEYYQTVDFSARVAHHQAQLKHD